MKIKIFNKLLLFFLLVSIVPMAIVGFVTHGQATNAVRNEILDELETLAMERVNRIERLFKERMDDLHVMVQRPSVCAALDNFTRVFESAGIVSIEYQELDMEFRPLLSAFTSKTGVHDVFLISPNGDVVFSLTKEQDLGTNLRTGKYKDTELARIVKRSLMEKEATVSEIQIYEPSNAPAVFLAAPVMIGNRLLGALAVQMPTKEINAVAGDYAGLKETGETSLISARANEIIWVAPTRHQHDAAFNRRLRLGSESAIPAQEASIGNSGRGAYPDYRGVPILAAWRHIPTLRLGLVIKMDKAEALSPVRTLTMWFIFLGLGTFLAVLAMSLIISRSIANPIVALTRAAGRMAKGDMTARTEVHTGNEIETLGMTFNDMAEQLQLQTESLKRLSSELELIIDSMPGLVFYKDANNRYIRINKYVADAHRMTKDQLEGKSLFDLYPRDIAQAYLDDDMEIINSRKAKLNIDEPWQTETGIRWVNTSKIPYFDEKGEVAGVIGVSLDITDRKHAEEALAKKTRLTNAINKVFHEAITCETEEDIAKTCLSVAEELTGSKFGFIGEINSSGLMDTIAISNPGWEACNIIVSDAKNFIKDMPLKGIDRSTLKEGKSRIVNADQIATHPDRVGTPRGHPSITCFMGIPFKQKDKTIGMIGLANKEGSYDQEDRKTIEALSVAFYETLLRKRMERQVQRQSILKTAQAELSERMRGNLTIDILCRNIITYLCNRLKAPTGLIYIADINGTLRLAASYAHKGKKNLPLEYKPSEGLVGQAALEKKEMILTDVPKNYFTIESGLGEALPHRIHVKPIVHHNGQVKAVVELGTLHEFDKSQSLFLETVAESIAIAIESAENRTKLARSLKESQQLSEELQAQQEELKTSNEELEEQTQCLKESEEKLRAQQEELQITNEELEEKNDLLERKNKEVERTRKEIEEKAKELAMSSKYKSEFLANMSHELRSPLNSLLLLAQGLIQNKKGNLTEDNVEAARIIHGSGSDLLNLINEILDLSRIEAGRMDLQPGTVMISDLADGVRASFGHLAEEKGLGLEIIVSENAPVKINSDRKRIEQITRNLISNALKFTDKGSMAVTFGRPASEIDLSRSGLSADECLSISVKDTGIGIKPEQQKLIFRAFQQADGGTARKYGGTGLGLSISRELAHLLGGEIHLKSEPGKGSTFTLYLPVELSLERKIQADETTMVSDRDKHVALRQRTAPVQIEDDRGKLEKDDKVILIIEDDHNFARILHEKCHERGFKCLATPTGEAGLELANKYLPSAVILDISLPGMDGWAVLSALKENIQTRHIPVHIASVEAASAKSFNRGALGHVTKPLTHEDIDGLFQRLGHVSSGKPWRLLIVEDDPEVRSSIVEMIGNGDVITIEAENGAQALEALRSEHYDCVVLDLGLPDISGNELFSRIESEGIEIPPVIVYTARDLTRQEEIELREHAESIIIKDVRSQERLLDEVSLFLHRVVSQMPEKKQNIIRDLYDTDASLRNKKLLIVDDDMRTTFAISSRLSERGMKTLKAENGMRALKVLEQEPDVNIVLMDIMMPVMDGYETIRKIRAQERFRNLPIIALTAKAMPDDYKKCIAAGASDYMSKPVDEGRLISMLRVWLYR